MKISVIHYSDRTKGKKHIIVSFDAEKGLKNQNDKNIQQIWSIRNFLNMINSILENLQLTLHSMVNNWKLSPPRSETREGYSFSPLLFNNVLEILARENGQGKKKKGIETAEEEVKLSLFTDNIILHIENLEESTQK